MSVSISTFVFFILLIPGLIFRQSIYFGSIIKRPIASSNIILYSVSIITYSVIILSSFIIITSISIYLLNFTHKYSYPISFVEFKGEYFLFHNHIRYTILNFASNFPLKVFFTGLLISAYSFSLALLTQFLSRRFKGLGDILYGPLSPILSKGTTDLITCFVLTKTKHDNKILMYAGFPIEISLKGTNKIDHIVIRDPEKFYLTIQKIAPVSTFFNSRRISTSLDSFLYISGEEIENVHFEGFYFPS